MLPHVSINVAMTADGKLAPANRRFIPFGSERDKELLLELRAQSDAVMSGARTVDLYPVNLGPGPKRFREKRLARGLAEYNLRVVVTGTGTLDPNAKIFQTRFSPILILVSHQISSQRLRTLQSLATEVGVFGRSEVDFVEALRWLREKWNVRRLICEGGGGLNDGLLRAGVVNELYVTICPLIFGGHHAPTLADGRGMRNLAQAVPLQIKSKQRVGDEMYLVYRVSRRSRRTSRTS